MLSADCRIFPEEKFSAVKVILLPRVSLSNKAPPARGDAGGALFDKGLLGMGNVAEWTAKPCCLSVIRMA